MHYITDIYMETKDVEEKSMKKIIIILCACMLSACGSSQKPEQLSQGNTAVNQSEIKQTQIEITGVELDEMLAMNQSFLLYVYGANCSYCHKFSPILLDVLEEQSLQIFKIVVDTNEDNFAKVDAVINGGLNGWPALYVFADGEEIAQSVGLIDKQNLEIFVDANRQVFQ